MTRKVFYSFHYDNDVFRVQQIRNIGILEGNSPTTANQWEHLKQKGDKAVQKWIDDNIHGKSCLIVLIGEETASRKWVQYEIVKAWNDGKGVLGIYVHNLKDPNTGIGKKGLNPFDKIKLDNGEKLSKYVRCFNPSSNNTYSDIASKIDGLIEEAINSR